MTMRRKTLILCGIIVILTAAVIIALILTHGKLLDLFRKTEDLSEEFLPETKDLSPLFEEESDVSGDLFHEDGADPFTMAESYEDPLKESEEEAETPEELPKETAETADPGEPPGEMTGTVNGTETAAEKVEVLNLVGITELRIDPQPFPTGSIVSSSDLVLTAIYESGMEKQITGLTDLFFTEETTRKETRDEKDGISGIKRTITIFQSSEIKVPEGETPVTLCYQDRMIEGTILGKDLTPPVIKDITFRSEGSFCKEDLITIRAEDESALSYALKSPDEEPVFQDSPKIPVTANGSYTVLVKDAEGNVSESPITVANIDQVAPLIENIKVAGE